MGRSKSPHTMFSYYVPLIVVTVAAPVADVTTSISTVLVPPDEPTAINIDGELIGCTPLEMRVLPNSIKVFV